MAASDNVGLRVWGRSASAMASSTSREFVNAHVSWTTVPETKCWAIEVGTYGPNRDPKTSDPF